MEENWWNHLSPLNKILKKVADLTLWMLEIGDSYHSNMAVNVEDAFVGALFVQLWENEFLYSKHHTIFAPDPNGRAERRKQLIIKHQCVLQTNTIDVEMIRVTSICISSILKPALAGNIIQISATEHCILRKASIIFHTIYSKSSLNRFVQKNSNSWMIRVWCEQKNYLLFSTAFIAYSTWNTRPSGEKVDADKSY